MYNNNKYYQKKEELFLFLSISSDIFDVHCLSISNHDIHSAVSVFRNMFPAMSPVGVFKVSELEAVLIASNFRSHNLTVKDFVEYSTIKESFITHANLSGYTNVYLDKNDAGAFCFTLDKTSKFFGFLVNQRYLKILNLFLHGRKIDTTTAVESERNDSDLSRFVKEFAKFARTDSTIVKQ